MISKDDKNKFLEELKEVPIVSVAAKRCGISKATIYRWKKSTSFSKKLQDALTIGRRSISDLAESQLLVCVKNGEPWAIRYLLESNDRRYYRPRKAISPPAPPQLPITFNVYKGGKIGAKLESTRKVMPLETKDKEIDVGE